MAEKFGDFIEKSISKIMKLRNKYFILRHGKTIYQGRKKSFIYPWPENPPVKLTKKGEKEIKKIAQKLKKEKINLIYSSDIFRARQTAEIVAKELSKKTYSPGKQSSLIEVIFDKRLRDLNWGIYHNQKKEKFYQAFPDRQKRFLLRPKGGESWLDVQKRMLNFLKEIDRKYKNKKILIVSHGDPLWLLEGAVKNLSQEELLKQKLEKKYIKTGELRRLF